MEVVKKFRTLEIEEVIEPKSQTLEPEEENTEDAGPTITQLIETVAAVIVKAVGKESNVTFDKGIFYLEGKKLFSIEETVKLRPDGTCQTLNCEEVKEIIDKLE